MSISRAEYMLKYQKAKVKLLEYDVPEANYPKFPLNYHELSYPTVLALSEYADAVKKDDEVQINVIKESLLFCAEFYDAAMKSKEQNHHDMDFLLSGAAAYFFLENYGSAMVLLSETEPLRMPNGARSVLADILFLVFYGHKITDYDDDLVSLFEAYTQTGIKEGILTAAENKIIEAYINGDETEAFFVDITFAIIKIAIANSARELLPAYSEIKIEKWTEYFNQKSSIKMIWPAQKIIGENGILKGRNAIVQMPTGVGKTKSIELIIRSLFLSERGTIALIIAPLRALCNEIAEDMHNVFVDSANINQFSDLLEQDFETFFDYANENTILICTPEKLHFILHHRNDLISKIDLFIFDEGHLFDDRNRGALYELLIEGIKKNITPFQQIVLLSAVLPNAGEILEWVAGPTGVLAYDEKIKSTPKVIGFTSNAEEVHYYSNSFSEEDFYIPRAIKRQKLVKRRKNAKDKFFPENDAKDFALYYSNQLCKNGGVAIYVVQRRSIPNILNRLIELKNKGCILSSLIVSSDEEELRKLYNFIVEYYGLDYVYSNAALMGILPHYSSLPNGLRLAVEYAFRKGKIRSVVCTSTLAQGVNIPIKYLIMTSLRTPQGFITSRNLQNLIGRTARAGVYTEGSIIVSDPRLYDQRNHGKGYYDWQNAKTVFQPQNAEACGSAILSLVQSFPVNYETSVSGKGIIAFICNHFSEEWVSLLKESLFDWLQKNRKITNANNLQTVSTRIEEYESIIGIIENEICHCMGQVDVAKSTEEKAYIAAMDIYNESLAKALANEEEKTLLRQLFETIAGRLGGMELDYLKIGMSMVDADLARKIITKIADCRLNDEVMSEEALLKCIIELYNELYPSDQVTIELCHSWINGDSYSQIANYVNMQIMDIEKKCAQSISYQLSFVVGNVLDYLSEDSVNAENLGMLQKKIKYGVNTITTISICESIVNDRVIASIIENELDNSDISSDRIKKAVKSKKEDIIDSLADYPLFFTDKVRLL